MKMLRQAYQAAKGAHPGCLVGLRVTSGYNFFYRDAIRVEAMTGIALNRLKPPGVHIPDRHVPTLLAYGYNIVSLDRGE